MRKLVPFVFNTIICVEMREHNIIFGSTEKRNKNKIRDNTVVICARVNIESTLENVKCAAAQENTTGLHENVIENKFHINFSKSYKLYKSLDLDAFAPFSYQIIYSFCIWQHSTNVMLLKN